MLMKIKQMGNKVFYIFSFIYLHFNFKEYLIQIFNFK